jgi:hypothetical protein
MGKRPPQRESLLQSKILKDLRYLQKDCMCFKIESANEDGIPDIFFTTELSGGVFIETKRENLGRVSGIQETQIAKINACGGKAFTCFSWDEWIVLKINLGLVPYFLKNDVILKPNM